MAISKEKQESLKKLFGEADKKFGKGSSKFGNAKIEAYPIHASTGSLNLDVAFGIMGIPKGRILEGYGGESSGKTTLALHMIREVQNAGGVCAFIDMEHAMDRIWAAKLGVNLDELIISQPDCGEDALGLAEMYAESGVVDFVVVDSVAACTPKAEIEAEISDAQMGALARLMGKSMRRLVPKCGVSGCTVYMVNQIRMKIGVMFGSPETQPGGNALKFAASIRMRISNDGSITDKSDEQGQKSKEIKIKVEKNKLAPPFMIARCKLHTNEEDRVYGFDTYEELVELAVSKEIMSKAGTWYSYGEERLGQGKKNVANYFKENPEIYKEIYNKVVSNIAEAQKSLLESFGAKKSQILEEKEVKKKTRAKKENYETGNIHEVPEEDVKVEEPTKK